MRLNLFDKFSPFRLSRLSRRAVILLLLASASFIFSVKAYSQGVTPEETNRRIQEGHINGTLASWYPLDKEGKPMNFASALLVLAEKRLRENPSLVSKLPVVNPNKRIGKGSFQSLEIPTEEAIAVPKIKGVYFWGFRFSIPENENDFAQSVFLSLQPAGTVSFGIVATQAHYGAPIPMHVHNLDYENTQEGHYAFPGSDSLVNMIFGSYGVSRGEEIETVMRPGQEYAVLWIFEGGSPPTHDPKFSINSFLNKNLFISSLFTTPIYSDEYKAQKSEEERLSSR